MECVSRQLTRKSLLLAHARGAHHAHSHVGSNLARGAHAVHHFGLGHFGLGHVHAAEKTLLGRHVAIHVHIHAAIFHSVTVMTHTHAHHLLTHHHLLGLGHLAHHFIHFLHLVHVHHFKSPPPSYHPKHLITGIWAKFAY
jgi:hypothetical protein